jgi:hypothetical protein
MGVGVLLDVYAIDLSERTHHLDTLFCREPLVLTLMHSSLRSEWWVQAEGQGVMPPSAYIVTITAVGSPDDV